MWCLPARAMGSSGIPVFLDAEWHVRKREGHFVQAPPAAHGPLGEKVL
jgi:hypothetical protein